MTTIEPWVPAAELARRQERCRDALAILVPEAGGLLVFSRLNIFYLAGTYAAGVLWLPLDGAPVLLSRRGVERARLESHLKHIGAFRSFRDLPGLFADAGSPLTAVAAAEMTGISWALGRTLAEHLDAARVVPGDRALSLQVDTIEPTVGDPVFRVSSVATNDDVEEVTRQGRAATTDATVTTIVTLATTTDTTFKVEARVVARRTGGTGGAAGDGAG